MSLCGILFLSLVSLTPINGYMPIVFSWKVIFFLFYPVGAIELSILSEYYRREIAAYDIQTSRCDLYGQVSPCHNFVFHLLKAAPFRCLIC